MLTATDTIDITARQYGAQAVAKAPKRRPASPDQSASRRRLRQKTGAVATAQQALSATNLPSQTLRFTVAAAARSYSDIMAFRHRHHRHQPSVLLIYIVGTGMIDTR